MSAPQPIDDRDALLRRIPSNPEFWERTDDGTLRVRSTAFARAKSDAGVSVSVRRLLDDPARPETALEGRAEHGLIEFQAAVPRGFQLDVVHAPEPEHFAHANIVGFPAGRAARNRIRMELAKAPYTWVCHPAGAPPAG